MNDQIKQLEERIKALEANQIAVIMSVNADTNLYRSWLRTVMGSINIGIGTSNPSTSTIMDIASTTLAFRLPTMTETQRDAITAGFSASQKAACEGFLIFNSTTHVLNYYSGSAWAAV